MEEKEARRGRKRRTDQSIVVRMALESHGESGIIKEGAMTVRT